MSAGDQCTRSTTNKNNIKDGRDNLDCVESKFAKPLKPEDDWHTGMHLI